MKLVQVINGEITQTRLPKTGYLKDGRSVSGYNLLDAKTLANEGWLPLEDKRPLHNEKTHYLADDGYDIQAKKVVKKYTVEPIPEQEPDEFEQLIERVATLESKTDALEKARAR